MIAVYLSNQNIQVLQGEAGKEKAAVNRVYETIVPEECLINGIITDKELLKDYLKNFWQQNHLPKKDVRLVVNSSQFVQKSLTLPKMKTWQLMRVLEKEFSDVERRQDPIYSYRILSEEKASMKLLATMAERSFVGSFVELFAEIGVEVAGINTVLGCTVRLLERLPSMKNRTCIVQLMEDNNLTSILWMKGSYEYASRTRLFSDHGTRSMGTEVSRTVSNLMQFYSSLQHNETIQEVYVSGLYSDDAAFCTEGIEALGAKMTVLDVQEAVEFAGEAKKRGTQDLACLLGNLFKTKNDRNLFLSYKKKPGEDAKRRTVLKYAIPVAVTLGIGTGVTVGMFAYNHTLQAEADELSAYLSDPSNVDQSGQSTQLERDNAGISRKIRAAEDIKEALASYPKVNSVMEAAVAGAGGKDVSTELRSYDGPEGKLTLKASSPRAEGISGFASKLQQLPAFRKIEYSGYSYDRDKDVYDIDIVCYLAERAGNADEVRDEDY